MLSFVEDKEKIRELMETYNDFIEFLNIDVFCLKRELNGKMFFIFNEGEVSKKLNMPTGLKEAKPVEMQVGHEYSKKLNQYYKRAFNGEIVKYKVRMSGIVFDTILMPCLLDSNKDYIIGLSKEVTMLEKLTEYNANILRELNIVKQRDILVDVYSRVALKKIIQHQLTELDNQPSSKLALVLLDIDRLTQVNDVYGHTVGDQVLIEVGEICSASIRGTDYLGRWLGGQFLIVSPDTSFDGAMNFTERLRKTIENNIFTKNIQVTASFGVAIVNANTDFDEVIWCVEKAMHKAKRLGKNKVVVEDVS